MIVPEIARAFRRALRGRRAAARGGARSSSRATDSGAGRRSSCCATASTSAPSTACATGTNTSPRSRGLLEAAADAAADDRHRGQARRRSAGRVRRLNTEYERKVMHERVSDSRARWSAPGRSPRTTRSCNTSPMPREMNTFRMPVVPDARDAERAGRGARRARGVPARDWSAGIRMRRRADRSSISSACRRRR